MIIKITFSDLSNRKNTKSSIFSMNSELDIVTSLKKPPAVAKADRRGADFQGLAPGQQTAKDADYTANKQETDSHQQQRLANDGGAHGADILQNGSSDSAKGSHESTHSVSCGLALKTLLLSTDFCRAYIPYGVAKWLKPR